MIVRAGCELQARRRFAGLEAGEAEVFEGDAVAAVDLAHPRGDAQGDAAARQDDRREGEIERRKSSSSTPQVLFAPLPEQTRIGISPPAWKSGPRLAGDRNQRGLGEGFAAVPRSRRRSLDWKAEAAPLQVKRQ